MAAKDKDLGVKILVGGLIGGAVILALISNADPEDDAWYEDDTAAASTVDEEGASGEVDAWSAGGESDEGLPACDDTAPFSADGSTVRLPVDGPVVPFASTDCRLDEGYGSAEAIRLLQQALAQCNGQAITVDGAYGSETRQAVRAVQAEHGIGVDGTYGPQTRAAMTWPATPDDGDGEGADATTCAAGSGAG